MNNYREVTKRDLLELRIKCCEAGFEMAKYFAEGFSSLVQDYKWYKEVPEDSKLPKKYVEKYHELNEKLEDYKVVG